MKLYDEVQNIYPIEAEIKYNYINIDGVYILTIIVTDYPRVFQNFEITEVLSNLGKSQITFYIKKEDKVELLKNLTRTIALSREEIITTHENRIDKDILDSKVEMAKKLRAEIQINNQEVYKINMYITLNDKNLASLKQKQKQVINYLYSKQILSRSANFRQKEAYITSLPLNTQDKLLENLTTKYMTTSGIANIFPFYTKNIMEENGIIIGKHNNELCMFDIFDKTHTNYNICVLGSSGSGKSYFVKLMILRNLYKGNKQIVFDPEGEYVDIARKFNQTVIAPEEYNLMYIHESFVKRNTEDFLYKKTEMLIEQIKEMNQFIVDEKNMKVIRETILKTYNKKSITNDVKTMYKDIGQNVIYIDKKYMEVEDFPTFNDLKTELNQNSEIEPKIKKNIINTIDKLNCKLKKIEKDIKLIVLDFSKLKKEKFKLYMNVFFETLKELEEDETIIYIDEIWKCVSFGSDEKLTNKIYDMFKTLRKRKMGIVSITQDIYDFFTYQDGLFGKSILNNSYNKVIFSLQYVEVTEIKKIIEQKEEDINKIKLFEKGKALVQIGGSRFEIKVQASDWEHEIIEGRKTNEDSTGGIK